MLTALRASLFFFFTAGMSGSSLHLASINTTTIENLTRRSKVWILAIYITRDQVQRLTNSHTNEQWAATFPMVTFPVQTTTTTTTTSPTTPVVQPSSDSGPDSQSTTPDNANNNTRKATNNQNMRTFAILRTQPGESPFDLGDPIKNLQEVMGHTIWDWLLPWKVAPGVDHSSPVSAYPMGPVVDRLKREAGIISEREEGVDEGEKDKKYREKRHRRRQTSISHQISGEVQQQGVQN